MQERSCKKVAEILRVERLVKNYYKPSREEEKEEIKVLKQLDFAVEESEFIGVMGKSGCGKSTLLKVLGLIERPTEGTVFFRGKEIRKLWDDELSDIRRREIGFVFQDFYLMDSLSVEENIMLPLILDKIDATKCFEIAKKYAELFEISHLSKKNPYELSGGEKQRVAICRALANNPELILADEPTGNLDSRSGAIVVSTLEKINSELNKTILMVTHDPQMASHCKRVLFLKDGKILKDIRKKEGRDEFYLEILEMMKEL